MEATQRLHFSSEEDEDDVEKETFQTTVFGKLTVLSDRPEGHEETYDIFGGENKIGRDPDQSRIAVDNKSLSRTHAVIEVSRDGTILLYDDHSMNGTLRNGSKLKPGVHYAMNGTEDLTFGEVRAKFSSSKSGIETPVKNTNGSNYYVPETPAENFNPMRDKLSAMSASSPLVRDPSASKSIFAESPALQDKTGDESAIFLAPSQPVSSFNFQHGSGLVDKAKARAFFGIPESQPYDPELEEDVQAATQTEAFGTSTMGLMEMETQQFQLDEESNKKAGCAEKEEVVASEIPSAKDVSNVPREKEGYEAEAPKFDEDNLENLDVDQGSKSVDESKTEIAPAVVTNKNQLNVETQLLSIDLALQADALVNQSTETIESLDVNGEHEKPECDDTFSEENNEVEEKLSLSPIPSNCATQLEPDGFNEATTLTMDDTKSDSSETPFNVSYDQNIFQSSPSSQAGENKCLDVSNVSATLLENLDQDEMEREDCETSENKLSQDHSGSPSPRFEKDTSQEEYVECYQGATQLFAEIDPEENLKDCGEESNDASEDDFIASSQVTGPDRTNFVSKTMSLTPIKESLIGPTDESLSQIQESDLESDNEELEMTFSQEEKKTLSLDYDQDHLPVPSTGILNSSTPIESEQAKGTEETRPISAHSSDNERLLSEEDSEKYLDSTQSLMEFQAPAYTKESNDKNETIDHIHGKKGEIPNEVASALLGNRSNSSQSPCIEDVGDVTKTVSNKEIEPNVLDDEPFNEKLDIENIKEMNESKTKEDTKSHRSSPAEFEKMSVIDSSENANLMTKSIYEKIEKEEGLFKPQETPSPSDLDADRISIDSTVLAETDRKSPSSLKMNRRCKQTPTKVDTAINESGIDPVIAKRHIDMSDKPKETTGRTRRSKQQQHPVTESLPLVKSPVRPVRRARSSCDEANTSEKSNKKDNRKMPLNYSDKKSRKTPNSGKLNPNVSSSQNQCTITESNEIKPVKVGKGPSRVKEETLPALPHENSPQKRMRGRPSKSSVTSPIQKNKQSDDGSKDSEKTKTGKKSETTPPEIPKRRGRPSKSTKSQKVESTYPIVSCHNSEQELTTLKQEKIEPENDDSVVKSEFEHPPTTRGRRPPNSYKDSSSPTVSSVRGRGRPKSSSQQTNAPNDKKQNPEKRASAKLEFEPVKAKRGRPSKAVKEEPIEKSILQETKDKKPRRCNRGYGSLPEPAVEPTRSTRSNLSSESPVDLRHNYRGRPGLDGCGIGFLKVTVVRQDTAKDEISKNLRGKSLPAANKRDLVIKKEENETSPEKKLKQDDQPEPPAKRGRIRESLKMPVQTQEPSGTTRKSRAKNLDESIKKENDYSCLKDIVRTRMSASLSSVESSHSGSRPRSKPVVMFTGFESKQYEKTVKDLGGTLSSNPSSCTVLVTDKVRRTVKFLCAIGRGIPIVSLQWLVACKAAKIFLDPWNHILVDEESEKKWGFRLKSSLETGKRIKLLEDFSVYVTKKCTPPPNELKEIIECAGGKWLKAPPTKASIKTFVVGCPEDGAETSKLASKNIRVYDKEILLSGLLTQTLDFDKFSM